MAPQTQAALAPLPLVWVGPLLRRAEPSLIILWFVTSTPVSLALTLKTQQSQVSLSDDQLQDSLQTIKIGQHCFVHLLDCTLAAPLPLKTWVDYELHLTSETLKPNTAPPDQASQVLAYGFYVSDKVEQLAHGSCRRPHSDCEDGLVALDRYIAEQAPEHWPNFLVMTGDQVYVDDVAGPMLQAIHQLAPLLGIVDEPLPSAGLNASKLHESIQYYYQREQVLPDVNENDTVLKTFFGGIRKPIFTTVNGGNHLMSFAEVIAMYLLCWSPTPWRFVQLGVPTGLGRFQARYERELPLIQTFAQGLEAVQRVLAKVPTAMIFDDHDVTDDWNLSVAWEEAAYNNPLANRIIGNALISYFLCQGWGNAPQHFDAEFVAGVRQAVAELGQDAHEKCITSMLEFRHWHYEWPTQPGLIVIDSRTNRWRSEQSKHAPSGLMDWESITDLQQNLCGRDAVLLVSPAPMFGVKIIEAIQHVFTFFGKPLMVDAENWMAHPGSAYALMNLFRHPKTPEYFTILSGDVHYSFVYQVELRGYDGGPNIWQITSSGIKNEFPARLLDVLDRLNRWLYSPKSPLNWFTKRKRLRISPYVPDAASKGERLLNGAGIGLVSLDDDGKPVRIAHLNARGEQFEFQRKQDT